MSLALEIEFLTGVCRAAREPGNDAPDWPPQPDRVFSALVSAWASRGERPGERAALEWLEEQPPPTIHASGHSSRTTPDVFVPPNDSRMSANAKKYIQVLPEHRPRQPRRFPVARPDDPRMLLVWPVEPATKVFAALSMLAGCIGYLGHSASLVRCRFRLVANSDIRYPARPAQQRVYPGRLRELETAHCANPVRPAIRPGAPVFPDRLDGPKSQEGWLVLEAMDGEIPDIRAASLVCRKLRHTLMSGYRKAGLGDAIPEIVSGHTPDRTPTQLPHLAIVPMAFAGFPHADGRILGFALIPPSGKTLAGIKGFRTSFESVAHYCPRSERRIVTLEGPPLREPLRLAPAPLEGLRKRSLSPEPYLSSSRIWASTTPVVLERHLKRKGDGEIRELVASACANAGIPQPDPGRIQFGKHSAFEGIPPAKPLAGEPRWMEWQVPRSLASRSLVHVIIEFEQDIPGPVLLGAGRFTGLGLCRAIGI